MKDGTSVFVEQKYAQCMIHWAYPRPTKKYESPDLFLRVKMGVGPGVNPRTSDFHNYDERCHQVSIIIVKLALVLIITTPEQPKKKLAGVLFCV